MINNFLKEIYEQPKALKDTLNYYINGEGQASLEKISGILEEGNFDHVLFTGMGSSYFAPHTACCMLSNDGIASYTVNTSELLHYNMPLIKKNTLLVCISQSGESFEIVKIMEKIPAGVTCVGITNEENSTLAKKSGIPLLSFAGTEEMTSTKTYVSTLLVLSIFTKALAKKWGNDTIAEINTAIEAVSSLINTSEQWLSPAMEIIGHPSYLQIIGRGSSYSSVMQGALMFMEAVRSPTSGIYGGEFRHGPMEMVKEGFRAILLAPLGNTYWQSVKMAEDITKFGGRVVLITNSHDNLNNPDIFPVRIPCHDEFLFPIPAIVPLQFMVNQSAVDRGEEPGNFTRGAKVTITE